MSRPMPVVAISEAEFLEGELHSEIKHELIDGTAYAMSGGRPNHHRICVNIIGEMRRHLKGKTCEVFNSDMMVKAGKDFFYPDVLVNCSDIGDNLFTEAPTIIVEVLSRSSRRRDETTKRFAYLQLPSLQEYVLIEQDIVDIEVVRRSENWQPRHYFLGDEVTFESIGLTLSVEEIYDRVENQDTAEWLAARAQQLDE